MKVSRYEITNALAIVSDSALKNAPVTPVRNASGRKITMVASDDPVCGRANSRAAWTMRARTSPLVSRSRRMMCSSITTTSSISSPTAAAMPPSVIMLKLMCSSCSNSTVIASVAGTTSSAIRITRVLRRNTNSTRAARPMPIRIASRTLPAAPRTSWVWSYQAAIFTPPGICGAYSARRAFTASTIWMLLAAGCWNTCTSTAGLPSAVTRTHCGTVLRATVATSPTRTTPRGPARTTTSPSACTLAGWLLASNRNNL